MAQRPKRRPNVPGSPSGQSKFGSGDKVRAHRVRMRKRGFRLVQMWVPDTRSKEFIKLAHKASVAIANSPTEVEDQAFIDSVSWWNSEEAAELTKREADTSWWQADGKPD